VLSRRRAAAAALGGGLAGARPKRARGLGLARGQHLHEARDTASRSRAAAWAKTRRRGRPTRRRGARTPARSHGRRVARGCQQAAPGCSSPPCAAPGRPHGDEAAAEPRNRRRRRRARLGFRRGGAARARGGSVGASRGRRRLIKAWEPGLGVRATRRRRTRAGLGRRRWSPGRSRRSWGMTGGPPRSAAAVEAGSGGRSWASRPVGWAGGLLGCAVLGHGASGLGKEKKKTGCCWVGLEGWAERIKG
jgi:hypothetical protein